jgi:2-desacetyl-2-hydroxyethyl bacteriochlorophyllide A dehydrogenase
MVRYPVIPGHEIAAQIVECGTDVPTTFKPGLRVTVSPYSACGTCSSCRLGRVNCCRYNQTLGVQRDGAAAEYLAIPFRKVFPAPQLSAEEAACAEPMSVGWHAVNRLKVKEGEKVLVLGCGVIGLGAIAAAAYKGAHVIAADVDEAKLGRAQGLGASFLVNSAAEDPIKRVQDLTNGDGADAVVEAVGLPQTYTAAVEVACFGGRVALIGYVKAPVQFETKWFVSKELDILGSRNAMDAEIEEVIRMLSSGRVNVKPLISRRYLLEQAGQALADWDRSPNEITKILLHP